MVNPITAAEFFGGGYAPSVKVFDDEREDAFALAEQYAAYREKIAAKKAWETVGRLAYRSCPGLLERSFEIWWKEQQECKQ